MLRGARIAAVFVVVSGILFTVRLMVYKIVVSIRRHVRTNLLWIHFVLFRNVVGCGTVSRTLSVAHQMVVARREPYRGALLACRSTMCGSLSCMEHKSPVIDVIDCPGRACQVSTILHFESHEQSMIRLDATRVTSPCQRREIQP